MSNIKCHTKYFNLHFNHSLKIFVFLPLTLTYKKGPIIERPRLIKFLFAECFARNHSENVFKMFLKFVPKILYITRSQSHFFGRYSMSLGVGILQNTTVLLYVRCFIGNRFSLMSITTCSHRWLPTVSYHVSQL